MSYSTYLLFTDNFPASMLEIAILDGKITNKISNRVFVATLPTSVFEEDFNYTSFTPPSDLGEDTLEMIRELNRDFSIPIKKKAHSSFMG